MVITAGLPPGARAHVLSETGKQYAIYVLHGNQINLSLQLPPGKYQVEWMDPVTGVYIKKEALQHRGGIANVASPVYTYDTALRIVNSKK